MKKQFDQRACTFYLELLRKTFENGPSDAILDENLAKEIEKWYDDATIEKNQVNVWNYYKYLLDICVHGSLCARFMLTLFDLEQFYDPPPNSYSNQAGNMNQAPWRNK